MERFGNFSSSGVHNLIKTGKGEYGFGAPALTYIKQKKYELELGRALDKEASAKPLIWGNLLESMVFDRLPLDYKLESKTRYSHETLEHWNGMPDLVLENSVGDIKCPYTMLSFVDQIKSHEKGLSEFRDNHPEYYWQLVSNSILLKKDKIQQVIYCPYLSELPKIREKAKENKEAGFIVYAEDRQLPYLVDGGKFKDINIFEYEVPKSDKDLLTERVEKALILLNA